MSCVCEGCMQIIIDTLRANFGQGWEALLEPEMECAVGGDCRQPGPSVGKPAGG